jgi:hypothetical protein
MAALKVEDHFHASSDSDETFGAVAIEPSGYRGE